MILLFNLLFNLIHLKIRISFLDKFFNISINTIAMSVRFLANCQLERRLYYKSCTSSSYSIKALPNISNKYFGGNGISLPI